MPSLEDITKVLTLIGTVFAGIVASSKWLEERRKQQRARKPPNGNFPFDVIKPRSPDLLKQIMGGDENNPLADYKIPYQERQPNRSIRQELEHAFTEKNWVLILGKSGLGKTREAAHLADVLNQEGWTVLKLADRAGKWLDVPKQFPSELSPNDKLLFFLDDLNRWMYAGNHHKFHLNAGEELARPLLEPVQEQLLRLLQYFEQQGKLHYVRVIAIARNETEPDNERDIAQWDKLQWQKYKSFWDSFHCYELEEPSESAIVSLLTDCVAAADMQGVSTEYEQIARRNNGTFRNIMTNLESAKSRGLAVHNQEFSPNLDETWRQRYNQVVKRYPLATHAYDAVELLRSLNLWLTAPMLAATTKRLLPGRGLRRWWQAWQLQQTVLPYLITTEQLLKPKDGQIEAKKTGAADVGRYVPAILQQLAQMAKQDPTYPVVAEYFNCGKALSDLGRNEEAIASYDKALAINPDLHEAWYSRGYALYALRRKEEAIASYEKALAIKPDDDAAWNNRGNVLSDLGRKEEAIASYYKVVQMKPDDDAVWYNRGVVLSDLGRKEEAIVSYDKALKIKPDDHEAWYNLGNVLDDLGRKEEAIASYDKALAIKPDKHEAWNNRGLALSALERKEEAIASYDKALEIKPDKHEAWNNRGNALSALGRKKEALTKFCEAIASYDQGLEFAPNDPGVFYSKACCYALLGNVELALEHLHFALNLDSERYQELAKTDSDFDGIRDDARFQAVIGE